MRGLKALFVIANLFVTGAALAIVAAPCNYHYASSLGPGTSLTVSPASPNSDQTVDIAVGYSYLPPLIVVPTIHGSVIDVTLTARGGFADLAPAAPCMSTTVGPLPPGAYTVNYYLIDVTNVEGDTVAVPQFIQSTPLVVVPAMTALSCFAPSENEPPCTSTPGCIFVCPQPAVSSAKLNVTIGLTQLPANACVENLKTSVTDGALRIAGTYASCTAASPAPPSVTYLHPSFEPLAAGEYALSVTVSPDASYPTTPLEGSLVLNSSIFVAASTSSQPNFQGLWWAAPAESESGWGLNIAHQGSLVFLSWFTFDFDGKAHWFVSTLRQTPYFFVSFTGPLYDVIGPAFDTVPFPPIGSPAGATGIVTGGASLAFDDANNGHFSAVVDGYERYVNITRQNFGREPNCTWGVETDLSRASNYTDLWWASPPGSEAGWGISLTHQDDIIFATWFTYDTDRTPMWLAVQANKIADGSYAGIAIKAISGPPLNAKQFPPLGSPGGAIGTVVGTVNFSFTDGNAGSFIYTVNGVTQTKVITREVFAGAGTVCQ